MIVFMIMKVMTEPAGQQGPCSVFCRHAMPHIDHSEFCMIVPEMKWAMLYNAHHVLHLALLTVI